MRIALISDTHGNYPLALHALEQSGQHFDLIIHLGDGRGDLEMIAPALGGIPTRTVAGNTDFWTDSEERELLINLEGRTILATHGDMYRVKFGLDQLIARASDLKADVALYGHTHHAQILTVNNITLINPGSLAKREFQPSFAILTITDTAISAEIIPVTP